MSNKIKTAFLIIRVEEDFKILVIRKAKKKNQTISDFLREFLKNI